MIKAILPGASTRPLSKVNSHVFWCFRPSWRLLEHILWCFHEFLRVCNTWDNFGTLKMVAQWYTGDEVPEIVMNLHKQLWRFRRGRRWRWCDIKWSRWNGRILQWEWGRSKQLVYLWFLYIVMLIMTTVGCGGSIWKHILISSQVFWSLAAYVSYNYTVG